MPAFFQILEAIPNLTEKSIKATIIHVDGSAYLKEGTFMIMLETGERVGMISPGCLEEDLFLRSKDVFHSSTPRIVTYDLSSEDDLGWGQGMGCNGIIRVLLEPITEELKTNLLFLKDSLEKGLSVLHEIEFSEEPTFKKSTFQIYHPKANKLSPFNSIDEGFKFTYLFKPPPRMIIFGAGEDAKPLVSLASKIGYIVTLCDWRPDLCNESHFPSAHKYITGTPSEIVHSIHLLIDDFIIIMSHNFSKDQEFLNDIKKSNVHYIGILGSLERTMRLIGGDYQKNLYFPVGLPIGAQGPDEIAVSIMAQIIQKNRKLSVK